MEQPSSRSLADQPRLEKTATRSEAPEGAGELALTKIDTQNELPFSIYGHKEKTIIIIMASLASLFSPLSANIYYPATNTLASDLHVSPTLINLTITSYLICQGIAPTFVGTLADECGRRPAYIICFTIYLAANIGLALQDDYAALFVLRCLQSSGSSGTVALASAVVADIVTSAERGLYIGYASMGALIGPAFGPVIGGLLSKFLGWRAIFWFLTISGGVTFVLILLMMPETCRKIVGNGSFAAQRWNVGLLSYLKVRKQRKEGNEGDGQTRLQYKSRPSPLNSVRLLMDKETGLVLGYAGILFAGYYMVLTGMPNQLEKKYGFNTLQIGLCYIPTGFGSLFAAMIQGKFLNWNFARHAKKLGIEIKKNKQQDLRGFPIEAARLQVVLPLVFFASLSVIGYGWVMMAKTNLVGPLILLFLSTFAISGSFQGMSALVIDLNRTSAGTATAAMNLARCLLGAGAVAMVIPLLDAIGVGWTSVLVAGVWALLSPIILIVIRYGPQWREEKHLKEKKNREQSEKDEEAK